MPQQRKETESPKDKRRAFNLPLRKLIIFALFYVTVTVSLSFGAQAMLTYHKTGQATLNGAEVSTPHKVVWALIGTLLRNNPN